MITFAKYKEELGQAAQGMSDQEISDLLVSMQGLAGLLFDSYQQEHVVKRKQPP